MASGCSLLVTLGNKSTLTPGKRPPHHSNVLPVRRQTRARSAKERRFRSREVTATVLQPGWYERLRAGQIAAANSMKYLQNGVILGRSRTCLNVLVRPRMAEVTSSSLVGSTPNNGSSATENYRTQRSLSRDPELLTATVLQPRIEFVRVPNKPPLV